MKAMQCFKPLLKIGNYLRIGDFICFVFKRWHVPAQTIANHSYERQSTYIPEAIVGGNQVSYMAIQIKEIPKEMLFLKCKIIPFVPQALLLNDLVCCYFARFKILFIAVYSSYLFFWHLKFLNFHVSSKKILIYFQV